MTLHQALRLYGAVKYRRVMQDSSCDPFNTVSLTKPMNSSHRRAYGAVEFKRLQF
jgi:hypothetical protein